jgi:hypothetical protein
MRTIAAILILLAGTAAWSAEPTAKPIVQPLVIAPSCTGTTCPAPAPVPLKDPAGIAAAQQAYNNAITAYVNTSGSLSTAYQALAAAQSSASALAVSTSAARTQIDVTQAALLAAINGGAPVPPGPVPPTPAPSATVELLEIGGTACPACRALDPVIADLQAGGMKISTVNIDADPTALAKWKPAYLPTFAMIVNGKEINRWPKQASDEVYKWDKAMLADWAARTQAWADAQKKGTEP